MAKHQRYERGTKTVYARADYRSKQSNVEAIAESVNEDNEFGNAVPSASGPCGSHDEPSHASCATHDCCVGHNTSECQNIPAEPHDEEDANAAERADEARAYGDEDGYQLWARLST